MYLLYVDDAGSIADPAQKYFVLAGLAVFERQTHWLSQGVEAIAARFNPGDPGTVELHGSPMLNGSKLWRGFPLPDRVRAMKDALGIVAQTHPSTRVFGIAVRKAAMPGRDPVEYAFEQICSRFDQYLMRLHKAGDTQRGIIVFDKMTTERTLQGLATDFRTAGHTWGIVRNLSEVPLFLDSRASRMVQLADLLAYGIFRHCERGDPQFFDVFKHRFDSDGSTVHGFVHRY